MKYKNKSHKHNHKQQQQQQQHHQRQQHNQQKHKRHIMPNKHESGQTGSRFFRIANRLFRPFLPADLDHIKTVCGRDSRPFAVLIWSKSAGKSGRKIGLKSGKRSMY